MRPRRALQAGARYSITARINRDENILTDTAFKELFLTTIKRAKKRYAFSINNICILDSIVKMIILPGPNSSLSRIMQWILSVFAINFNKRMRIRGHVWYDRFKSSIIADIEAFLAAFKEISSFIRTTAPQYHGLHMLVNNDGRVIERPPDELKQSIQALIRAYYPDSSPGG